MDEKGWEIEGEGISVGRVRSEDGCRKVASGEEGRECGEKAEGLGPGGAHHVEEVGMGQQGVGVKG